MSKFFNSACNFWKQGCCCIRTVKSKEASQITMESPSLNNVNDSGEIHPLQNLPKVEKTIVKPRKDESPPSRIKRIIKVWTEEEDVLLKTYYSKYGANNWLEIAKHIPGRNASQCSQRWRRKYKPEKIRKNWIGEEDNLLMELVSKYGQNWQVISNHMRSSANRTGKQIRERYLNKLDPKISREPFTEEEDRIVLEEYKRIGKKWSEISKILHGRPENSVKNRFYSHIKRKILKEEEGDKKLERNEFDEFFNELLDNEDYDNESSDQEAIEKTTDIPHENLNENPNENHNESHNENPNENHHDNSNENNHENHHENSHEEILEIDVFNQETPHIKINNIVILQSTCLLLEHNPHEIHMNNHNNMQFEGNASQNKMEISELLLKPFEHKMSLEETKVNNYDYSQMYKANMNMNFDTSGNHENFHKGFSTETEKLLRSINTFEKDKNESNFSNSDNLDINQLLKFKEQNYNFEASNNLKQEDFHIEKYLDDNESKERKIG